MNIISINNVCKNYKSKKALDNISLTIKHGELFGLLGVNGAGKTTLFKVLLKEQILDSGKIIIKDKRIGYLPQEIQYLKSFLYCLFIYQRSSVLLFQTNNLLQILCLKNSFTENNIVHRFCKSKTTEE